MGLLRKTAKAQLRRHGYLVRPTPDGFDAFCERAETIAARHRAQTVDDVVALRTKYANPVFGDVLVWDLVQKLALVVDPSDENLGTTNQLLHALQVADAMAAHGIDDGDMLIAALTHDLGKLLLLVGEAPENVVCMNEPIGDYALGVGLDNCTFQWNHDEFVYTRLKDHAPEPTAWLLRYHSIHVDQCAPLMDERDRACTQCYLRPFRHYDQDFKSQFSIPRRSIEHYRDLLFDRFPRPVAF